MFACLILRCDGGFTIIIFRNKITIEQCFRMLSYNHQIAIEQKKRSIGVEENEMQLCMQCSALTLSNALYNNIERKREGERTKKSHETNEKRININATKEMEK